MERRSHKKKIKLRRCYYKRLLAEFQSEIQSQHFCSNDYLSIEGVTWEYYKKYDDRRFPTENIVDALIEELNYHLPDNDKKERSITTEHIIDINNILVTKNIIIQNASKTWEETNMCTK